MPDSDSPDGFLRSADKEYLTGQKEYEHQSTESDRKRKIRERVSAAMDDFVFLMEQCGKDEIQNYFDEQEQNGAYSQTACVRNMIAFSYVGLNGTFTDITVPRRSASEALEFHDALRNGIVDGKERFDSAPHNIFLTSNVPLWELPEREEVSEMTDYDDAGDKNEEFRHHSGNDPEGYISKGFADADYRSDVQFEIGKVIYQQRKDADFDVLDFSYHRV